MSVSLSSIPIKVYLVVDGAVVPITACHISFEVDGASVADCELAVGGANITGGATVTTLDYPRGTPAQIHVVLDNSLIGGSDYVPASGDNEVFNGYVDDCGPGSLSSGSFGVEIRLFGQLSRLDDGTLQASNYTASAWTDFSTPSPTSYGGALRLFPGLDQDFAQAYLAGTLGIATDKNSWAQSQAGLLVASQLGFTPNTAVAGILKDITGKFTWADRVEPGVRLNVAQLIEDWHRTSFRMTSWYGRFRQVGQLLGCRLIEDPQGLQWVPFTPFQNSTVATYKAILPSTYTAIAREVRDARQYSGWVLSPSQGAANFSVLTSGVWRRPGEAPGVIQITDAPPYMRSTFGNTYTSSESQDASEGFPSPSIVQSIGNLAAREVGLAANYMPRSYMVASPFVRTDLGLLTPVEIIYPDLHGVPTPPSIYGVVLGISISISSSPGSAVTRLRVGYARTASQQTLEVDDEPTPHPLWDSGYAGRSLVASSSGASPFIQF